MVKGLTEECGLKLALNLLVLAEELSNTLKGVDSLENKQ